jgi:epoxyqueuosine reductase
MPISISKLRQHAAELGFSSMRVTNAELEPSVADRLQEFNAKGFAGGMDWLADPRRTAPRAMWPEAKSALILAMNYGQDLDHTARLNKKSAGTISVYALNRDYHDVIKGRLKTLAQWLHRKTGEAVKVFVDTAPLMEKPLAQKAGTGWQGKHTNLVSRDLGSWFFLGVILSSADLAADAPEVDHCGSCRACLDACPTKAFPQAGQLDARRCISYLTIEHKDHIPDEFRKAMGNRIYGCDDCLAACPWNKFAVEAREIKLLARPDLIAPPLADLMQLDDQAFRKRFAGSPVKRIGRNRFIRNCLIAAGNSGDQSLITAVKALLVDEAAIVRAAAVWALRQLSSAHEIETLREKHQKQEPDAVVAQEWAT